MATATPRKVRPRAAVDAHQHVEFAQADSRMMCMRSMVSISWCGYRTRTPMFGESVRASTIFLVRVVTSTRSPRSIRRLSPTEGRRSPADGSHHLRGDKRSAG